MGLTHPPRLEFFLYSLRWWVFLLWMLHCGAEQNGRLGRPLCQEKYNIVPGMERNGD